MGNIFKCCGKTGKPTVRVVAYIDIVLAIVVLMGLILTCAFVPGYFLPAPQTIPGSQKHEGTSNVVGIVIAVAIFFVECCLTNIILSAVKNERAGLCDNWIKIRLILLVLFVFVLIYWLSITDDEGILYLASGMGLIYIFYRVYTLLVVKHFQNELSAKDIKRLPLGIPMQVIMKN